MRQSLIVFFACIFLVSFNVQAQQLTKKGDKAKGKASYYSSKFNGKKTASGERYYASKFTCAHLTLPFGTELKVTNLRNRKTVVVKVNDRGPFSKGRLIDLSFGAASRIDMLKDGVGDVEIEIVSIPEQNVVAKEEPKKEEKKTETKTLETKKATTSTTKKTTSTSTAKTTTTTAKSSAPAFSAGKTYNVWGTEQNVTGYGVQIAYFASLDEAVEIGKEASGLGLTPLFIQCGWEDKKQVYRLIYGNHPKAEDARDDIYRAKTKGFKGAFLKKHL